MREEIEIRLESLKTELEDKAEELNDELNQIESQILENKTTEDSIKKNIEDFNLKKDERFKNRSESLKSKILNLKSLKIENYLKISFLTRSIQ